MTGFLEKMAWKDTSGIYTGTNLPHCHHLRIEKTRRCGLQIIWPYKQWQPLYDDIRKSVYPRVEFVQGIPLDIEQDSFINPSTQNIVIFDDLMSTASKDSRINELLVFTEGSHHRNLSVIAINQNLYYNKDPTQRRNCHYLVLFNNSIDKQQVMPWLDRCIRKILNSWWRILKKPHLSLTDT